jgi:hypothetical protein
MKLPSYNRAWSKHARHEVSPLQLRVSALDHKNHGLEKSRELCNDSVFSKE